LLEQVSEQSSLLENHDATQCTLSSISATKPFFRRKRTCVSSSDVYWLMDKFICHTYQPYLAACFTFKHRTFHTLCLLLEIDTVKTCTSRQWYPDMILPHKATAGIATRVQGSFISCGVGRKDFELTYNRQGPACSGLDDSFLDITCHRDGSSRLICLIDSVCQSGRSSYQSNFTFTQNEPDPWSPTKENERDT